MLDDDKVLAGSEFPGNIRTEFCLEAAIRLNAGASYVQCAGCTIVVLAEDPDVHVGRITLRSSGNLQIITLCDGGTARGRGEESGSEVDGGRGVLGFREICLVKGS